MNSAELLLCAAAVVALIWMASGKDESETESDSESGDVQDEGLLDSVRTKFDELTASQVPVSDMSTSAGMLDMLKRREKLVLSRYELGDGGYTWGYGHFSKNKDELPLQITKDQAESIFVDDVVNRGEKWVKVYVKVDLDQSEFDALVSIAFNMSPRSFRKFADSVNRGDGIDDIAQESIGWVAAQFTNGIANRRRAELNVYNEGIYS